MHYAEVPTAVADRLREICNALPEVHEERMSAGHRWWIRKRTFAHVMGVDDVVVITFRSDPPELDALWHAGHPFFKPGWGRNGVGMVIDDKVDWDELAELLTDSYCIMAPKKLAALVNGASG